MSSTTGQQLCDLLASVYSELFPDAVRMPAHHADNNNAFDDYSHRGKKLANTSFHLTEHGQPGYGIAAANHTLAKLPYKHINDAEKKAATTTTTATTATIISAVPRPAIPGLGQLKRLTPAAPIKPTTGYWNATLCERRRGIRMPVINTGTKEEYQHRQKRLGQLGRAQKKRGRMGKGKQRK